MRRVGDKRDLAKSFAEFSLGVGAEAGLEGESRTEIPRIDKSKWLAMIESIESDSGMGIETVVGSFVTLAAGTFRGMGTGSEEALAGIGAVTGAASVTA